MSVCLLIKSVCCFLLGLSRDLETVSHHREYPAKATPAKNISVGTVSILSKATWFTFLEQKNQIKISLHYFSLAILTFSNLFWTFNNLTCEMSLSGEWSPTYLKELMCIYCIYFRTSTFNLTQLQHFKFSLLVWIEFNHTYYEIRWMGGLLCPNDSQVHFSPGRVS